MQSPSVQGNAPIANEAYTVANGTTSTDPFITYYANRDPTPYDINYPIKKRWVNFQNNPIPPSPREWILESFSNITGQTLAIWVLLASGGSAAVESVTGDDGIGVFPNPLTNEIGLVGETVVNGTNDKPVYFKQNATYAEELDVQVSTAAATAILDNAGLSSFLSTQFTVDPDTGFVQIKGGAGPAVLGLHPDAHTAPGTDPVVPDASGNIKIEGGATFATGTQANPIRTNCLAANTMDLQIQLAGENPSSATPNDFGVSQFDANQFNVTSGFVQIKGGTTPALLSLSDNSDPNPTPGTVVTPFTNGNIQLEGQLNEQSGSTAFNTTVGGTNLIKINPMSAARWIVDPLSTTPHPNGTHTTIEAAITAASSGDTILIMTGTFNENPILKAGVNLTAFGSDSSLNATGNVIINGTCTLTGAGSVTISGIQLQTNSAALLAVTGSAASIVNLNNCYLNCSNNTGISFSSSSISSAININNCGGNLATTGIAYFANSSSGILKFVGGDFTNTGGSTTASTLSASSSLLMYYTYFENVISTSGTSAGFTIAKCFFDCGGENTTPITHNSTNASGSTIIDSWIGAGTASGISIGAGAALFCTGSTIQSSNTDAITGSGTLTYTNLTLSGPSALINTTAQTGGVAKGGLFQAPSAGFIGEQIRSAVASGSAVSLTNNTPANITSVSLTAGIWDVSLNAIVGCSGANTFEQVSISTTSATQGTEGDNSSIFNLTNTGGNFSLVVPAYRLTLTTTTPVYAVVTCLFSAGTSSAYGRLSATRVG